MTKTRYLTKSRFKLALECPTKLFYTGKNEYANKQIDDPFLMALAKGGFQVGELAKCYFPEGIEVDSMRGNYDGALARTNELLEQENVTIFEAAVRYENYFIRVDVLKKTGNKLEVIEVKSKSYREGDSAFFGKAGYIDSSWKPYLYDIAFQKFVVQNAFPASGVSGFLMLADKGSTCPTDGLNQKFRVKTRDDGQKYVEVRSALTQEESDPANRILKIVNVDAECQRIFDGTDTKVKEERSFADRAAYFAEIYASDDHVWSPVFSGCKECEFCATAEEEAGGKLSGLKECWKNELGWSDEEFERPHALHIWDNRRKDKMIAAGRLRMADVTEEDLGSTAATKPGMSRTERQWMQVCKARDSDESHMLHSGLADEFRSWTFPLHFIDFETATPAIPFVKGRRPYEEVAFQFSHHIVHEDGRVEHVGQHLDDRVMTFPNFDFVRQLKDELTRDDGTIFRYAAHENTYVNAIYRQLMESGEHVADRDELLEFIRTISKISGPNEKRYEPWEGPRNMVDLKDMVVRYYYHPATNGSNSIKAVLPAMLNGSKYLKERYSQPLHSIGVTSLNFPEDKVWVEIEDDKVSDPYASLPRMFGQEMIDRLSEDDDELLKDGGAAMMAYARLQFEDMSDIERKEIKDALLRYCELDTLAMVMIYEGWRDMLGLDGN